MESFHNTACLRRSKDWSCAVIPPFISVTKGIIVKRISAIKSLLTHVYVLSRKDQTFFVVIGISKLDDIRPEIIWTNFSYTLILRLFSIIVTMYSLYSNNNLVETTRFLINIELQISSRLRGLNIMRHND